MHGPISSGFMHKKTLKEKLKDIELKDALKYNIFPISQEDYQKQNKKTINNLYMFDKPITKYDL